MKKLTIIGYNNEANERNYQTLEAFTFDVDSINYISEEDLITTVNTLANISECGAGSVINLPKIPVEVVTIYGEKFSQVGAEIIIDAKLGAGIVEYNEKGEGVDWYGSFDFEEWLIAEGILVTD